MTRMRAMLSVFVAAGFIIWTGVQAPAYEGGAVKDGGTITGTITFAGTAPERKEIQVTKDIEVCGQEKHLSLDLIVGPNHGIENAVVSLVDVKKGKKWISMKVILAQQGCVFRPHVLVVPAGGEVDILNNDGILHNIHTYSTVNPSINKAQPKFKKVLTEKLMKPEIIKVTCDAHGWMFGWILVSDHPYVVVTNEKGEFSLEDVPPGRYRVEVWQETLGKKVEEVTVKPREETGLHVEFINK